LKHFGSHVKSLCVCCMHVKFS